MQKRIPKELKDEVYQVLGELAQQGTKGPPPIHGQFVDERADRTGNSDLAEHAVYYLRNRSVLDPDRRDLLITAHGWDYWEELNTWAPWYWFKRNLFPASVAFGTILFGGASAAANIVNLLV